VHDQARAEAMAFDAQGRLVGLGVSLPATGEAFRTSGCPDCNRPFYNEHPGGPLYNYPRPLTAEEAARAIQEMEIGIPC
jgi:biotin synthase-related radical SAM superfamily protein